MTAHVYTTTADADGLAFASIQTAEAWLAAGGWQRRAHQPGQWVKLQAGGNLFASVVAD